MVTDNGLGNISSRLRFTHGSGVTANSVSSGARAGTHLSDCGEGCDVNGGEDSGIGSSGNASANFGPEMARFMRGQATIIVQPHQGKVTAHPLRDHHATAVGYGSPFSPLPPQSQIGQQQKSGIFVTSSNIIDGGINPAIGGGISPAVDGRRSANGSSLKNRSSSLADAGFFECEDHGISNNHAFRDSTVFGGEGGNTLHVPTREGDAAVAVTLASASGILTASNDLGAQQQGSVGTAGGGVYSGGISCGPATTFQGASPPTLVANGDVSSNSFCSPFPGVALRSPGMLLVPVQPTMWMDPADPVEVTSSTEAQQFATSEVETLKGTLEQQQQRGGMVLGVGSKNSPKSQADNHGATALPSVGIDSAPMDGVGVPEDSTAADSAVVETGFVATARTDSNNGLKVVLRQG